MNGPFGAMYTAATGVTMAGRWLDTLSHNISNVNTMTRPGDEPFRARYLLVEPDENLLDDPDGVSITGIVRAEGDAPLIYDPSHPFADEDGVVQGPVVDMAGQMSDLIIAQRHYQANLRAITTAREAYESALSIGRR